MFKALIRSSYCIPMLLRRQFSVSVDLCDIDDMPVLKNIDEKTKFNQLNVGEHADCIYRLKKRVFQVPSSGVLDNEISDSILMTSPRINLINQIISIAEKGRDFRCILSSLPGLGKSTILFALANEMFQLGWLVIYITECDSLLNSTEDFAESLLQDQRNLYKLLEKKLDQSPIQSFWNNFDNEIKRRSYSSLLLRYLMAVEKQTNLPVLIIIDQFNQIIHEEAKLPTNPDQLSLVNFLRSIRPLRVRKGAVIYGVSSYEAMKIGPKLKGDLLRMHYHFPALTLAQTKIYIDLINSSTLMKDLKILDLSVIQRVHEETSGLVRPLMIAAEKLLNKQKVINPSKEFLNEVSYVMERLHSERLESGFKHAKSNKIKLKNVLNEIKDFTIGSKNIQECFWLSRVGIVTPDSYTIPKSAIESIKKFAKENNYQSNLTTFVETYATGERLEQLIFNSVEIGRKLILPIARGSRNADAKEYKVEQVFELNEHIDPNKPYTHKIKKFSFVLCYPGQKVIDAFFLADTEAFFFSISALNYSGWIREHEHQYKGLAEGVCNHNLYEWLRNSSETGTELPEQPDLKKLDKMPIKKRPNRECLAFPQNFLKQIHFVHLTNSTQKCDLTIHEKDILTIEKPRGLLNAGLFNADLLRNNQKK